MLVAGRSVRDVRRRGVGGGEIAVEGEVEASARMSG